MYYSFKWTSYYLAAIYMICIFFHMYQIYKYKYYNINIFIQIKQIMLDF